MGPSGSIPVNEYFQKEYPVFENFPTLAVLIFDAYLFMDVTGVYPDAGSLYDVYINEVKDTKKISGTQICNPFVNSEGVSIQSMVGYQSAKIRIELANISASQNGKKLTLKFGNVLNYKTTQRSMGIRNLKLYLFKNASQYSDTINFPCGYSFFWDNTRGCVPCAPHCKICAGESYVECTSCETPYYFYPNGTCMANCVAPFTPSGYICNKKCTKANQPILLEYSNSTCQADCLAPLQPGTWSGLVKTCSACTKYLYSNNSCLSTCPAPLLNKLATDGTKSCYNPCAGTKNFLWPHSTCITNCFLVIVNGVDGQYCLSHCPNDYIYPDVSCLSQCKSPLNQCGEDEYLEKDGSCHSKNLAGYFVIKTIRDGKPIDLTFVERVFNAEKQEYSIFAEDYQIDSTWSIFGLDSSEKYSLDNWEAVSNCGYFPQTCGVNCEKGRECHNNKNQTSNSPWLWDNYCWSLKSAGSNVYSSYSLNLISTIALTSFGGPGNSFISPGFTITNSLAGQNYAPGAMIGNIQLRKPTNISSSYRYAESEGRVITTQEFDRINIPPTLHASLEVASCNLTRMNLPLTLIYNNFNYHNQTSTPFHSYMILRKAQILILKTLNNYDILTHQGVQKWSSKKLSIFWILVISNF